MPTKPVLIALSPLPAMLVQAARCVADWDRLEMVGGKLVQDRVDEWIERGEPMRVLLLQGEVLGPARLRKSLEKLGPLGIEVDWFTTAEAKGPQRAARGLSHVRLHAGRTVQAAFEAAFPGRAVYGDLRNDDLLDYLRYKRTMCFMCGMAPDHLVEAARTVSKNGEKKFTLKGSAGEEAASVEHFRLNNFPYIEGKSKPLLDLKERIVQVANTELTPLVLGETGTGKEFVAFFLHEFSPRRGKPYVPINCAGLSEELLHSQLFGHKAGSFTGATRDHDGLVKSARGGTLFLDELGDMPPAVQADLLRFLETRRFRALGSEKEEKADVRIIAGAQPSLREKMDAGDFRDDLYYRLAQVEITTPPLRSVPEDIIRIVRHIAWLWAGRMSRGVTPDDVIDHFEKHEALLRKYAWPGNVRELAGMIARRAELGDDVMGELKRRTETGGRAAVGRGLPDTIETLEQAKARYLAWAVANKGDLTQAELCDRLGISPNTLKKYA